MTELADTFSVPRSQFYSSFLMTDSGRVSQRLDSNTKYIYKILHLFLWSCYTWLFTLIYYLSAAHCSKVLVRTLSRVLSISQQVTRVDCCFNFILNTKERIRKSAQALIQYVQRTLFGDDQLEKQRFCKPE